MNLFYDCASGKNPGGVLNHLIKRYKPENCYITCMDPDDYKLIDGNVTECYWYTNLHDADYSGYIFENECPPVDEDLLNSMAEYEPTIIKILLERLDVHDPLIDYEAAVRLYQRNLRYWNYMLDAAKIDVAVFFNIPHGGNYLRYCLCKKKGIAVATFYPGPFGAYTYFLSDITEPCSEVLEHYQRFSQQYRNSTIEEIELPLDFQKAFEFYSDKNSDKTPYYMKKNWNFSLQVINTPKTFTKRLIIYFKKILKNGVSPILNSVQMRFRIYRLNYQIKIRGKQLFKAYEKMAVRADFSKPYIYLPLHYQPEVTTTPLGGIFGYQLLVAEMLSFHLPKHVHIYVKENPIQTGRCRDIQFYRDLAALPNVKLVPRSTDTYKLIENCIAVASVTGTAGFEGMFAGKPFLMFGSLINMYAPGTFNIRNNEDCKIALEYILKHGAKHTLKDMKLYFKALSKEEVNCFFWGLPLPFGEEENIKKAASGLARIIDAQLTPSEQNSKEEL